MTAPFAPPPTRRQLLIWFILCAFAIAMPFVRREDWMGTIAFAIVTGCAIGVWAILIYGFVRITIDNRKN